MRLSQSLLLSANVQGLYHKPEGPAFCIYNMNKYRFEIPCLARSICGNFVPRNLT